MLAFLLLPQAAEAHAFLESASPKVGSIVPAAPTQVVLSFTQAVEPAFSKMEVTDPKGAHVETGAAHTLAADSTKLAVDVGKLPPGSYQVTWRVLSVDAHKSQGKFTFTVAP